MSGKINIKTTSFISLSFSITFLSFLIGYQGTKCLHILFFLSIASLMIHGHCYLKVVLDDYVKTNIIKSSINASSIIASYSSAIYLLFSSITTLCQIK